MKSSYIVSHDPKFVRKAVLLEDREKNMGNRVPVPKLCKRGVQFQKDYCSARERILNVSYPRVNFRYRQTLDPWRERMGLLRLANDPMLRQLIHWNVLESPEPEY